jgi:predicted porin
LVKNYYFHFGDNMKLSRLAALSGLVLTGGVYAQSVTIYGMVDTGIESVSNVGGGGTLVRMPSTTGMLPSRLGFRGKEDLGGGLSAIYTLEMGFGVDTGVSGQGGRLFGRQSTVGFSGDWGAVTLGRQWTMLFWSILDSDIVGPSVYGLGSLDNYIPNSRIDNSIAYKGKFGNVTVGGTYSLGRDTVNGSSPAATGCAGESATDTSACREWSAMVKYDTPSWGAALAYDAMTGGAGSWAVANLTSSSQTDSRLMVNGYLKVSNVKLAAGLIRRDNDGSVIKPKSDLWYVGASYPLTPVWTIDGTYAMLKYKDVSNYDASLLAVRALYALSKRTTLYAQVGSIQNDSLSALSVSGGASGSNPAAGGSQTGVMLGVNHKF